jgi:hypothetical protein
MSIRPSSTEAGSGLFIILIAIVLFAALTYALSRTDSAAKGLSEERVRLAASEIIETGNRLAETASRMRLKGTLPDVISFENGTVAGYANGACSVDSCKVFAFDGGGLEWETPSPDANAGENWGYTGDVAIENIGSAGADLVALLPNLPLEVCSKINQLIGIHDSATTPPVEASVTANKFTGAYNGAPLSFTAALLTGQKSGCVQFTAADGTAVQGAPLAAAYFFYQVLLTN